MEKQNDLPKEIMLLLALLQGMGLMILHQSIKFDFWPHQSPQWLLLLYTFFLIWPTSVLLSLSHYNYVGVLKYSLSFAFITCALGYYVGYQGLPAEHIRLNSLVFAYILTMGIASFKALMYAQQFSSGEPFTYSALFTWSWRNFLTLGLALLFAGGFWLILFLWGALFKAIGVDFFEDLFQQPWFYYPAIAIANGIGIIIFRNLSHVIDTITRLQQALMKFLLVVLVLVSILFLSALPLTGLKPLWESGGSTLILWMQALMLFFVNAVYQDDAHFRPFPKWVHRFIYVGVALLPIYSAISFYGLSLRVEQYGWSLARCWAFVIWFLLALFPLGYWWGIAKLKDAWVEQLSRVNVMAGLVVLAAMLLVNSPLLDFRKIVVGSQLSRLENQKTSLEGLDINYIKHHLARPGYIALSELKEKYSKSDPKFGLRIAALMEKRSVEPSKIPLNTFVSAIEFVGAVPPNALLQKIYEKESKYSRTIRNTKAYYLYAIELNRDESSEYLLIRERTYSPDITLFYLEDNIWMDAHISNVGSTLGKDNIAEFIEALKEGNVSITTPKWDTFEVNGRVFKVR